MRQFLSNTVKGLQPVTLAILLKRLMFENQPFVDPQQIGVLE